MLQSVKSDVWPLERVHLLQKNREIVKSYLWISVGFRAVRTYVHSLSIIHPKS